MARLYRDAQCDLGGFQAERPRLRNLERLFASAGLESLARTIAEKLGRLGALAALREANGALAETYVAARLNAPHATYGACDLMGLQSLLLARVLPPSMG
jgi:hypothetical protein